MGTDEDMNHQQSDQYQTSPGAVALVVAVVRTLEKAGAIERQHFESSLEEVYRAAKQASPDEIPTGALEALSWATTLLRKLP